MAGDSYLKGLLGSGEEILYLTHQHWLWLFGNLLVNSLLVIAIVAVLAAVGPPPWLIILALVSIFLVLVNMIIRIVKWSSNTFVITNRRVIHIIGALNKSVSSTQLEDISDTRIRQSVFGRMLDYADITVLTSSEAGRDLFPFIWHPQEFQRAVFDAEEALD